MTEMLVRALDRVPGLDLAYVVLGVDDYTKYPAPWWARLTDPWHAEFILNQKSQVERLRPFDILWVYGWENAVAFKDLSKRMPAAVMMDAVPATMNVQRRPRGAGSWKRCVSHQIHHRAFRSACAEFDYFLPKTSDCAASLRRDYGIDAERCFVTLAPQDLDWWAPRAKSYAPPWRALFVGNDFERKGGEFLLRLYAGHLSNVCTLKIVSNDPALVGRTLPAGVQLIRGANREEVRDAYLDSHLFLFPTRQDFAPQVVAEATAAGLTSLASDVDGVHDLIRHGETGFVLPPESSVEHWAGKIHGLLADPEALRSMSGRARSFAEQQLNLERFDRMVVTVVDRLRRLVDSAPAYGSRFADTSR